MARADREGGHVLNVVARTRLLWVAWVAGVAVVLAVLAVATIHTSPIRQWVWSRIQAYALVSQGLNLESGAFSYNLLGGRIDITGLEVHSARRPDLPALFEAGRVRVDLGVSDIVRRTLNLEEVSLEGVRIATYFESADQDNLPRSSPAEPESRSTFSLRLGTLEIDGDSVRFTDEVRGLDVSLPAWTLSVSEQAEGHNVGLRFDDGGEIVRSDTVLGLGPVLVAGILGPGRFELAPLSVESDIGAATIEGVIENFFDPTLDFGVSLQVLGGPASRLAGMTFPVSGEVQTEARVSGPIGALTVSGRTAAADLAIERLDSLDFTADWDWDAAINTVTIRAATLASPLAEINLEGALGLTSGAEGRAALEIVRIDLDAVATALAFPIRPSGVGSGSFSGTWTGLDWRSVTGGGGLNVRSAGAVGEGLLPIAGSLALEGQAGAISVELTELRAAGARLSGRIGVGPQSRLDGSLQVTIGELAGTVRSIQSLFGLDPNPDPAYYPRGPVSIMASIDGTPGSPVVGGHIASPALDYRSLKGVVLNADLAYADSALEIGTASVDWQNQTASVAGSIALGPPVAIGLRVESSEIAIGSLLAALEIDAPVDGTAGVNALITGGVEAPRVEAEVLLSGIQTYGQSLGDGDIQVDLETDAVRFAGRLERSGPGAVTDRLAVSGTYRIDSGQFDIHAEGAEPVPEGLIGESVVSGGRVAFAIDAGGGFADGALAPSSLRLQAAVNNARINNFALGRINLEAFLEQGQVNWTVDLEDFQTLASGSVGIESPYPARVEARMDRLDLALLDAIAGERNIGGTLTATLDASGTLMNWRDMESNVDLDSLSARIDGSEFRTEGPARLRFRNRQVDIDPVRMVVVGRPLDIQGSLPLDTPVAGTELRVDGAIDVSSLLTLMPLGPGMEASGELTVDARVGGSFLEPQPMLDATWTAGTLGLPALGEAIRAIDVRITLDDQVLTLTRATGEWAGAQIQAEGRVPLALISDVFASGTGSGPAGLRARISDLPLESIPGISPGLTGRTSLRVEAEAAELAPEHLRARIEFDRLAFSLNEMDFEQDVPTVITVENSVARLNPFNLTGPETRIRGDGEIDLTGSGSIRLDAEGQTDAGVIAAAIGAAESTGSIQATVRVRGTTASPTVSAAVSVNDATLQIPTPSIEIADLNVTVQVEPALLTLETLSATLNGGTVTGRGTVSYSGMTPGNVSLDVGFEDVAMEVPEGLRSLSRGTIQVRPRGELWVIGGRVEILDGAYTDPLQIEQLLFDAIRSTRDALEEEAPPALLARLRYDLAIATVNPIVVDNDTAQIDATAQLRLIGSYENPGLNGRVVLGEGAQIRLRETNFAIEQGFIDFANPNRIQPVFDVLAQAEAGGYAITLQVTGGGAERLETTLTSEPPLPEPDIVSVLLTGRRLEDIQGAEVNVATEQALSYLTGSVAGSFSRGAEEALGLSQVRIEPTLIANESDPGARLTVGQSLSRNLELIYSMDLRNSSNQIWIAEYTVARGFVTKSTKQDDNSYRFELLHDFQVGGSQPRGSQTAGVASRTVRSVSVEPASFDNRALVDLVGIEPGDRYLFFQLRRGIDDLSEFFRSRGYIEARIRVERRYEGNRVDLTLNIAPGPRVVFEFEGFEPGRGLRDRVSEAWQRATFDSFRLDQSSGEIRASLVADRNFDSRVAGSISVVNNVKTVRFEVQPGIRYASRAVDFQGVTAFDPDTLRESIEDAGLRDALILEPGRVETFLRGLYRAEGYIDARVGPVTAEFQPEERRARFVIPVEEGPAYRVGRVSFSGNRSFSQDELSRALSLSGRSYSAEAVRDAGGQLEQRYWQAGFNEVLVERTTKPDPASGVVDVSFAITENERGQIQGVAITGNQRTTENFVRAQLRLEPGAILSFDELNQARRRLYGTGAYSLVDIQTADAAAAGDRQAGSKPIEIRVDLREVAPYTIQYGAFFDTERGLGLIGDVQNRNSLLGSGRVLGIRARYDGDLHELRGYFSQPSLQGLPVGTNVSGFVRREIESFFITDRWGGSLQQETALGNRYILSYGYRAELAHSYERDPDPLFPADDVLIVAPLTAALNRDTRDDVLDASRGTFTSHSLEYALGIPRSDRDLKFIKYFGQFSRYIPLSAATPVPFSGGAEKTRFVFASNARIGLAVGLDGQTIFPSERFFAGGGTSMRGFKEDALGPVNFFGDPTGGDALLILNNEIRFPLVSLFDGVAFVDVGNVYSHIRDFSLSDLRKTGGFGLRVRTPYFLLRADYGVKLDRRPDEPRGAFFFSIGQAF